MDMLEKIIKEIKEKTAKEYIKVIAENTDEMTQFDSKFGGVPYIPNNFEYPYSKTNPEQPLKLLAQINFSEVPEIEEFKHLKGILQFYINPNDDCYGVEWDNNNIIAKQNDYRIIYHKDIDMTADNTNKIPEMEYDEWNFPIQVEKKLSFEKSINYISFSQENADKLITEIYNKYSDEKIEHHYKMPEEHWDIINNAVDEWGHKIGGNPNFTQSDEKDDVYTVQILQMDSDDDNLWGDCGVAHFFISEENLKNLNFNDVLYTWDCC